MFKQLINFMKFSYLIKSRFSYLSFFLIFSSLLTPLSIISFLEKPVIAREDSLNFISRGEGVFTLEGRQQTKISSVSFNTTNNQNGQVSIILNNNQTINFDGRVSRQNANQLRIQVTNSGMATASGVLLLEHNDNDIVLLEGKGYLDSQGFSIIFRNRNTNLPPVTKYSPLNLIQRGQGLLNIQGRQNQQLNFVSVQVNSQGKADISLGLQNGDRISFGGQESHRDSTNIKIRLTNSSSASADGFMNIRYGANNSIINLVGDGEIDGQPFLVNFYQ